MEVLASNVQRFKTGLLVASISIPKEKLLLMMQSFSVGLLPWVVTLTLFPVKLQLLIVGPPPVKIISPAFIMVKPAMTPLEGTLARVLKPKPDLELSMMLWPGPAPLRVMLLLFQLRRSK